MKSTGIVRRVDELGRVVIPMGLRKSLGFSDKEALEIKLKDDAVILSKPNLGEAGIVRQLDTLGRIVVPIEIRRTLNISERDALEIYVNEDTIVLKQFKKDQTCIVTGEISENNFALLDGRIILSLKGAEALLEELQKNGIQ